MSKGVQSDKEQIYDDQIYPLMNEIIKICKEHEIPMLATFNYAPEQLCTTALGDLTPDMRAAAKMITEGFIAYAVDQQGNYHLT